MSTDLQRPFEGYEHIASAGIWDMLPMSLAALETLETSEQDMEAVFKHSISSLANRPPYPYLRLLQSEGLGTKDSPTYVFQPALTRMPEEPFIPVGDVDDNLAYWAEMYLVTPNYAEETDPSSAVYDPAVEERSPKQPETMTIDALLPKYVKPIGFHPPLIEGPGKALGNERLSVEAGFFR